MTVTELHAVVSAHAARESSIPALIELLDVLVDLATLRDREPKREEHIDALLPDLVKRARDLGVQVEV